MQISMSGVLQKHKWENCMTIDRQSWGFRRNAVLAEYLGIEQLITQLAQTVRSVLLYFISFYFIYLFSLADSNPMNRCREKHSIKEKYVQEYKV